VLWFHEIYVFGRISQSLKRIVNVLSERMSRKKWMSNSFWWAQNKSRTIIVSTPKSIRIHIIHLLNSFLCVIIDQEWLSSFLYVNIGLNNSSTYFRLFFTLFFRIYIWRADHLYTNYYTFKKLYKLEISRVFVSKSSRLWFKGCCGFMKYMCLVDSANH